MEKITKKEFTETLIENTNILMGSTFRWTDEKCEIAMENLKIDKRMERRTVTKSNSSYILFSNGSRLDFNQDGRKEYFKYENAEGIKFLLQRTAVYDTFDESEYLNYIIYAVIEAEADASREFYRTSTSNEEAKTKICRWLSANGYCYKVHAFFERYSFKILCSEKEQKIIKLKFSTMLA